MSRKANRLSSERDPLFDYDDPDRARFITENAISIVKAKDERIRSLRSRIRELEEKILEYKTQNKVLRLRASGNAHSYKPVNKQTTEDDLLKLKRPVAVE